MAAQAFIFDLDGTIWNSVPWYAELLQTEAKVPIEETRRALLRGESIVSLILNRGISRGRFAQRITELASSRMLYDGIEYALRGLARRKTPLAVFTSLPGSIALPILSALKLEDLFIEVVHAGNCRLRKPNPRGIHQALQTMGLSPNPSVYYAGDQERDSLTAKNAAVSFAWASYGYGDGSPDFVTKKIDRPQQFLDL